MKAGIDKWEVAGFTCGKCGWSGKGSALEQGEMCEVGCEELCPTCHEQVAFLEFPMVEEMLAHADKLSPDDLKMAQFISEGHKNWNTSKLKSIDQLPEIPGGYIVLLWEEDPKTRQIVIRHGNDEVFRQVGSWEYYEYFISACAILKTKYGFRLLDVVPSPSCYCSLWGDRVCASGSTDKIRELIGRDCYPAQENESPERTKYMREWESYAKAYGDR